VRHSLITNVFVGLFLAFPTLSFASGHSPEQTLQVSVFNDARVPLALLTQAEARASAVLAQAGIRAEWLHCSSDPRLAPDQFHTPSPCSRIAFPSHLSIRLLPRALIHSEDAFGQSFLDDSGIGAYANVYYDRVASFCLDSSQSHGDLLGYIFAHEIGHLLLGPDSHSPSGVMCARWSPPQLALASRGLIFFTSTQSALMRSRIESTLSSLFSEPRFRIRSSAFPS